MKSFDHLFLIVKKHKHKNQKIIGIIFQKPHNNILFDYSERSNINKSINYYELKRQQHLWNPIENI